MKTNLALWLWTIISLPEFCSAASSNATKNIYCNRRFCKVFDIAVSSKYTKRGIGKQLINAAAEYARSRNVRQIELEVFSFNTNAEAFYKRLNFREVSRIMSLEV
ncbi:MAG: GNAT family N-acetyltransferase [Alphaproteobacteria bacterium]